MVIDEDDEFEPPSEYAFLYGDVQLPSFFMSHGEEVTIYSEWNIFNTHYAPDWAITVHGDSDVYDSLTLTHSEGLISDSWRVIGPERVGFGDAYKEEEANYSDLD